MEILEVEHQYPLKLIDLQQEYATYEEEIEEDGDDEDGDVVKKEEFGGGVCVMCREEINIYHRYYYKSTDTSGLSLHKFCAELPKSLDHALHPHPLIQQQMQDDDWVCGLCESIHRPLELAYVCYRCDFSIDRNCALVVGTKLIEHPCHPHLLMCANPRPILSYCIACGKKHEGVFYQCFICAGFTLHSECAFLPKTLLIQQTTDGAFYHTHPLTLSYSFPRTDQFVKFIPRCRVCGVDFYMTEKLWIYKCDNCMYYAHVDCATSRSEPFISIFLAAGFGKLHKNYKEVDHPRLLHLPFPDETYSLPKHLFFQESGIRDQVNLKHKSHQHPLILVDHNGQLSLQVNSSLLMCHDPMIKTELLCNGCVRPIMSTMPFYMCAQHCSNFALHEWCTRLPTNINNHPAHPKHTFLLTYSDQLSSFSPVFQCRVCYLACNGFAYSCLGCDFRVDVTCGLLPKEITHKAHPNHLLTFIQDQTNNQFCHVCKYEILHHGLKKLSYSCNMCDIDIHPECAMLLAEKIKHKYDKHPMHLSYLPIENHKSEYFCEMCERKMDPHKSFYHCKDCMQSIHTHCAPLIPPSDAFPFERQVCIYANIKFGGVLNIKGHPHPLFFARGMAKDICSMCHDPLANQFIVKCLECTFALDYYVCFDEFKKFHPL